MNHGIAAPKWGEKVIHTRKSAVKTACFDAEMSIFRTEYNRARYMSR